MKFSISQSKKEKVYAVLTKPYVVMLVMFFAPLLNYFDRNFSYFFGLGIVLLILWSSGYKWSLFGFAKRITRKTVLYSLLITAALVVVDVLFSTIVEHYFGKPNLSSLEDIKGNTIGYIITLIVVWIFAAFGEELLFRGYYMKWLAALFGNSNTAWITSGVIISIYFGASHYYQGISGVCSIIFLAIISSMIFYKNRKSLGLLVFIHGFHDTIGITLLYLDKINLPTEWVSQLLFGI